jgi:processing peptidase subunit alpha
MAVSGLFRVLISSGRETVMYQAAIFNKDLENAVKLFSSIVKEPLLLPEEIKQTCESSMFELDELEHNMDNLIPELLHNTAYRGVDTRLPNTYGHSLLGSKERLSAVSADDLKEFRDTWYTPERMVIAGVGMEHECLVDLVEKNFGDIPVTRPEVFKLQLQKTQSVLYTGGVTIIDSGKLPVCCYILMTA